MPDSAPIEGEAERVIAETLAFGRVPVDDGSDPEEAAARSALVVRADRTVARVVLAAIKEHWLLVSRDPSDPQRERMVERGARVLRNEWADAYKHSRSIAALILAALSPEEETE